MFDLDLPIAAVATAVALVASLIFLYVRSKSSTGKTSTATQPKPPPPQPARPAEADIVLFYGSQTGIAEGFSFRIAEKAESYNLKAKVVDLEEFDPEVHFDNSGKTPLFMFFVATYGEGEPTDNAIHFNTWLTDDNQDMDLSHVKFTVFGLGNTQYEHYNAMGKRVKDRLSKRGAKEIYKLGLGDDDKDIEDDFAQWLEDLWPAVCDALGVECVAAPSKKRPGSNITIETLPNAHETRSYPTNSAGAHDTHHPFLASVTLNNELFSSDRSCRHIEVQLPKNVKYHTGDHLAVFPENSTAAVEALAQRLGLNLGDVTSVRMTSRAPFTGKLKVATVLAQCVDLSVVVAQRVLGDLAWFATDEKEATELNHLASKAGKHDYTQTVHDLMLTLPEVLVRFPSVRLSLAELLAVAPRLQVRYYSIASSHITSPTSVHLCAAVVEYSKPNARVHHGVCSTYLKNLKPGDTLRGFVRTSSFHPPKALSTPLLLIGPGTGIAPFRGFIQDRLALRDTAPAGPCHVYYGTRHFESEYLYRTELHQARDEKAIELHECSSRDGKKLYVQNLLKQQGPSVWELLESGAMVYVCGLVQMSTDVVDVLHEIIATEGGLGPEKATEYWNEVKAKGRFLTDVWS